MQNGQKMIKKYQARKIRKKLKYTRKLNRQKSNKPKIQKEN